MRIAWLSDFGISGSGYLNLSVPICEGLTKRGHEVKASGLEYKGEEHNYNFSIIPALNMQEALTIIQNIYTLWKFDVLVVALDIPIQINILNMLKGRLFKYVALVPLEATPLCMTWAMGMMLADKIMVISEFGTAEMKSKGLNADHIQIGIDTEAWRIPTVEEKSKLRASFGIPEDDYVVLTVADNQERKNLSEGLNIIAKSSRSIPQIRYIIVTREHNFVGWKLRDYANDLGISDKIMIFERGMGFKELWSIYAMSDVFLLPSKAEGLGMPLLESMSMGIPCIGTNCSAITEVLGATRGVVVDYVHIHENHSYVDCFGNGYRYIINADEAAEELKHLYRDKDLQISIAENAHKWVEQRTWNIAIDQMEKSLQEVVK